MARTMAEAPSGTRLTDYIRVGVRTNKDGTADRRGRRAAPDRQGRPPTAGVAGARHGLRRERAGPLQAAVLPGGAALAAGGRPVAPGARRGCDGDGQVGNRAGAALLWRIKPNLRLPAASRLPDGS